MHYQTKTLICKTSFLHLENDDLLLLFIVRPIYYYSVEWSAVKRGMWGLSAQKTVPGTNFVSNQRRRGLLKLIFCALLLLLLSLLMVKKKLYLQSTPLSEVPVTFIKQDNFL
jgi:hypothetical protein